VSFFPQIFIIKCMNFSYLTCMRRAFHIVSFVEMPNSISGKITFLHVEKTGREKILYRMVAVSFHI